VDDDALEVSSITACKDSCEVGLAGAGISVDVKGELDVYEI
jgi:hypothetical protein